MILGTLPKNLEFFGPCNLLQSPANFARESKYATMHADADPSTKAFIRMRERRNLTWHGDVLQFGRREVARVVPEAKAMWRVQMPDGRLTDMVNRTRAKDAAMSLALAILDGTQRYRETRAGGPPVEQTDREATC
jgi:hypothetical protein